MNGLTIVQLSVYEVKGGGGDTHPIDGDIFIRILLNFINNICLEAINKLR